MKLVKTENFGSATINIFDCVLYLYVEVIDDIDFIGAYSVDVDTIDIGEALQIARDVI